MARALLASVSIRMACTVGSAKQKSIAQRIMRVP
jgi:hypothetical protein